MSPPPPLAVAVGGKGRLKGASFSRTGAVFADRAVGGLEHWRGRNVYTPYVRIQSDARFFLCVTPPRM